MIIWLASYPKSGNTWIRAVISALAYTSDGIYDPRKLSKIDKFPSKKYFYNLTTEFHNIHEIKKNWIHAQQKINLNNDITYFKTHHLNCKIDNYAFTNNTNTAGTIYIVRDPRNVVTSLSNHFIWDIEKAKNTMLNTLVTGSEKNPESVHTCELIGSWAQNLESWTRFNKNSLLIKYEDLMHDTKKEVIKIIEYINKFKTLSVDNKQINNAIESTTFEKLKNYEQEGKFDEATIEEGTKRKVNFFHLGKKNNWKNILNPKITQEIEKKFSKEMKELGYL